MSTASTDAAAHLRLLYEVTALRAGTLGARLDAALEMVIQALTLDVGLVIRIVDETYTVEWVYAPRGNRTGDKRFPLSKPLAASC